VTLDRDWRDLAKRLETNVQADDYGGAIAGLEDFLIGRLLTATVELKQIQLAARLLAHRQGQFRVTDLAYDFGYTDQTHFIRDFKGFADRTPGEFATEMRALQAVFRDHERVVFLQFSSPEPD
jgi:AraC-like DNA-binding protein